MTEKQSSGIKKRGGKRPGAGRKKGVPNKTTTELKEMILGALDAAGGVDYLTDRAKDPRTAGAFLTLVGKVLPMTVQGPGPNGEHTFQKIVVEVVKADK